MMEDWSTINLIKHNWTEARINTINKTKLGEYWLETQTGKTNG